jgi:diguanylate cyclase (GGDEF)-like protein
VLRQVGQTLRHNVRARDTVARLGGDEFGILLEHCTKAGAVQLAEKVRKAISQRVFGDAGESYRLGASIGVVPIRGRAQTLAGLLRSADRACYRAKRQGGDRVCLGGVPAEWLRARHRQRLPADAGAPE